MLPDVGLHAAVGAPTQAHHRASAPQDDTQATTKLARPCRAADDPATPLLVPLPVPRQVTTPRGLPSDRFRLVKGSATRGMVPGPALPRPDAQRRPPWRPLQRYVINLGIARGQVKLFSGAIRGIEEPLRGAALTSGGEGPPAAGHGAAWRQTTRGWPQRAALRGDTATRPSRS